MFMLIGVTGADGFIGSYLIRRLEEKGYKTKSFQGDLSDRNALDEFTGGCDQVIHLAGIFSNNFDELLLVNVVGTRNVADACKKQGVKRIIFSSTGAVYGEPLSNGISKETDVLSPNTLYGVSKLYAEEYLRFLKAPFIILRFPNVYGLGNQKGVIYNFVESITKQGKVSIFGTGEQKRNFLFVGDAVNAIIKALESEIDNEIYNIADTTVYDLKDVVVLLREIQDAQFTVEFKEADEANQLQVLSEDTQKAQKILRWLPETDLKKGLRQIVQNYEI